MRPVIDMSSVRGRLINFILFQIGWFACVLGAAKSHPWFGTITVGIIVLWHLLNAKQPYKEIVLLAFALLIGGIWETFIVNSGWITYRSSWNNHNFPPHWILAMWVLFATTLNVSLSWLKQRKLTSAFFGLVGGPLSFLAGARLGAVILNEPSHAMMALAIAWTIITPTLFMLANRYDGI